MNRPSGRRLFVSTINLKGNTMSTLNITLTPAEAAQVAEKVIEIAQEEFGYGEQARAVILKAIEEVRGESATATMEPGLTSITVPAPTRALTSDDLVENTGARPTLTERVEALEAAARRNGISLV